MKKYLWIVVVFIAISGYFIYDNNQKQNKANKALKICLNHFKTSDQDCLNSYWNYSYKISQKESKKNWPKYKKKVNQIENEINNLKNLKPNLNFLNYSYTAAHEITSYESEKRLKNKKILIAGGSSKSSFFKTTCYRKGYYVCLKQETYDDNTDIETRLTKVSITNIDEFPNIKKIIDELNSYAFYHYKTVVYGILENGSPFYKKIKADYITLETFEISDEIYEDTLMEAIYSIKRKEYRDYMKKNYK